MPQEQEKCNEMGQKMWCALLGLSKIKRSAAVHPTIVSVCTFCADSDRKRLHTTIRLSYRRRNPVSIHPISIPMKCGNTFDIVAIRPIS